MTRDAASDCCLSVTSRDHLCYDDRYPMFSLLYKIFTSSLLWKPPKIINRVQLEVKVGRGWN